MEEKREHSNVEVQPEFKVSLDEATGRVKIIYTFPPLSINSQSRHKNEEPMDYIFCLDISGSMKWAATGKRNIKKFELAKRVILTYVREHVKESGDTISIVIFDEKGKQVITRMSKEKFLSEQQTTFADIEKRVGGSTFMESAFNAISNEDFQKSGNKPVPIFVTDGDDNVVMSDIPRMIMTGRAKFGGQDAPILTFGIGADYKPAKLAEMIKQSGATQQVVAHIENKKQVREEVANVAEHNGCSKNAKATIAITINGVRKEFKDVLILAGEWGVREFGLNPNKLSDFDTVRVDYIYGDSMDEEAVEGVSQIFIKRIKPVELDSEPTVPKFEDFSGELPILDGKTPLDKLGQLVYFALLHKTVARINKPGPIKLKDILNDKEELPFIRSLFNELCELQQEAKSQSTDHNFNQVMNDSDKLLSILAVHINYVKNPSVGAQTSSFDNNQVRATAVTITGKQTKPVPGLRTANANNEMIKGLEESSYKIDKDENLILRFDGQDNDEYKSVGYSYNFALLDPDSRTEKLASVDGSGGAKREILIYSGLKTDYGSTYHTFLNNNTNELDGIFAHVINSLHPLAPQASQAQYKEARKEQGDLTRKERFNIATFDGANALNFKNGRKVPTTELANYLEQKVGVCRHQAFAFALIIGYKVFHKLLPIGEVRIFRNTAYNQNAHACTVYREQKYTLQLFKQGSKMEEKVLCIHENTDNGSLGYTVINPEGKEITGQISKEDLQTLGIDLQGPISEKVLERKLKPRVADILRLTSKRGDTSQPFHLFDPLLSQVYDLSNKEQLVAAIEEYNRCGMNGLLLPLIEKEGLDLDGSITQSPLFDVPPFNPALFEELGLDRNEDEYKEKEKETEEVEDNPFEKFTCAITQQVIADPVRPILLNHKGERIESHNLYERQSILDWMQRSDLDPMTRQKIAEIPAVDSESCKALRSELHQLIRNKYQFFNPENFTLLQEPTRTVETAKRVLRRDLAWESKAKEYELPPISKPVPLVVSDSQEALVQKAEQIIVPQCSSQASGVENVEEKDALVRERDDLELQEEQRMRGQEVQGQNKTSVTQSSLSESEEKRPSPVIESTIKPQQSQSQDQKPNLEQQLRQEGLTPASVVSRKLPSQAAIPTQPRNDSFSAPTNNRNGASSERVNNNSKPNEASRDWFKFFAKRILDKRIQELKEQRQHAKDSWLVGLFSDRKLKKEKMKELKNLRTGVDKATDKKQGEDLIRAAKANEKIKQVSWFNRLWKTSRSEAALDEIINRCKGPK